MTRLGPILAFLSLLLASPAWAEGAPPCHDESKACGGKLFDSGVKAFQAGEYDTALERFRAAYAIAKLPVVTFNLALVEDKLDKYEDALVHLDEVIADPATAKATREKAQSERDRISRSLATIAVELAGAQDIVVEVDGKSFPLKGGAVRVGSGRHSIRVVADGSERLSRSIEVSPGERLVLHLERTRELVVESSNDKPFTEPADTDKKSQGVSPTWFYVAAGATVVLAGVTVWSGLDTVSAKNKLDDDRPSLTIAEEQDRIDAGHSKETRTNVLLVATGVGAVATAAIGLFVVRWDKDKKVSFGVTGSSASVSGSF